MLLPVVIEVTWFLVRRSWYPKVHNSISCFGNEFSSKIGFHYETWHSPFA